MGSSLSSRLEHHQLLAALSIEASKALPTTVQCPICKAHNSLDVARGVSSTVYRCRNSRVCGFQGDGIELFAIATHQDITEASHTLVAENILAGGSSYLSDLNTYLASRELKTDAWLQFWIEAQADFRGADTYVVTILESLGLWESKETTCSRDGLGGILGAASGATIKEVLLPDPKAARRFAGFLKPHRTYLVMPMWVDYATVSGFTIIGRDRRFDYIEVPSYPGDKHGFGMIQNYVPFSDPLLGATDPVTALSLADMGFRQATRCPIIYLDARSTAWPWAIAKRNLLVTTAHSLDHYSLAMTMPDCWVSSPEKAIRANRDTLNATLARLGEVSKPVHVLLADMLCKQDTAQAIIAAQHLNLDATNTARVIGACPEAKRDAIRLVMKGQNSHRTIRVGNDEVSNTPDGWVSRQKGLVLNCAFYVDKIVYDPNTKEGVAVGSIVKDDTQHNFTASLRDIQKRTLDWLNSVLLENCAGVPVVLPGWASKLWNISIGFKEPLTVHTSNTQGWLDDGAQLVLPNMVIKDGKISGNAPTTEPGTPGFALKPPSRLEKYEAETLCFPDSVFGCYWALFSALCTNIYGPFHKFGTHGIALVDSTDTVLGQVVDTAIEEIGIPSIAFTVGSTRRLDEIRSKETNHPLPIHVSQDWNDNSAFSRWLRLGHNHNCLARFNKTTAIGTSLDGGWMYLSCSDPQVEEGLQRISGLWKALPWFIAWLQQQDVAQPETKTCILDHYFNLIEKWLWDEHGCSAKKVLTKARTIARVDLMGRVSSYGAKIVNFLVEHVAAGTLKMVNAIDTEDYGQHLIVDSDAETMFVSRNQMDALFETCGIVPPSNAALQEALFAASLLKGTAYMRSKGFLLSQADYNFQWAMRS